MPPSALVQLCTSQAELVLQQLNLKSLAALAATCKALHSVIQAMPDSTWQQAAMNTSPPEHPVNQTAQVRAFLRRQNAIHTSIRVGGYTSRSYSSPEGVMSADLAAHACLDYREEVRVLLWARLQCCVPVRPTDTLLRRASTCASHN